MEQLVKLMEVKLKKIDSLAELVTLEEAIAAEIRRHPLDSILLALRALPSYDPNTPRGIPPHVVGMAARFAIRYATAAPMTQGARPLSRAALDPILESVAIFAHADPVVWNPTVPRSPLSIVLRHVGNQFPYLPSPPGKWGRAQILYNELPAEVAKMNNVPAFDFACRFKELTGVTVANFIDVGYMAFAAAKSQGHLGFAREYFEKARSLGLKIPSDEVVRVVLNKLAASAEEHLQLVS